MDRTDCHCHYWPYPWVFGDIPANIKYVIAVPMVLTVLVVGVWPQQETVPRGQPFYARLRLREKWGLVLSIEGLISNSAALFVIYVFNVKQIGLGLPNDIEFPLFLALEVIVVFWFMSSLRVYLRHSRPR